MAKFRVSVDSERCIGAGHCALQAPEVFSQDEDYGVVILLEEYPSEEFHERVREAAKVCPARIITIEE
ncbi:ferredoxin [Parasphingorhabdus sp.]|uniref:ferredoxin n=1 Tax=Parasphingorhabdus sp. TaxID=2709688 RepID=UPI003A8CBD16